MTDEERLKEYFDDYPCYNCKHIGNRCNLDCYQWRIWFKKQWAKTTDMIKSITVRKEKLK